MDDNRTISIGKNKNVRGMMKDELGRKNMTEVAALRTKMYLYRKIDKKLKDKRCKCTKKCVVSEKLTFDGFKTCLFEEDKIYRVAMRPAFLREKRCTYRQKMLFQNKKHKA